MGFKKDELLGCVGTVNILLDDRVVLQGQIIKNCEDDRKKDCQPQVNVEVESENEFITLELTCDALVIRDNADLEVISPTLFQEGDRVRINVSEISAIGPSHGCPEEEEEV
ncbi:hypothetical protein [Sporomusa sp.]|uniref:hypothetical protein n=1 Tax=Sporomusa sp. TaxID=2078658 RepID=UPI002BA7FB2E|nr:hypothetical protein [Sporomusa sp.]HWR45677.1 hypothetical protein [Sporomusa sp.]